MSKFILTGCLLVLLASFLNYPLKNDASIADNSKKGNSFIFPISEQIKIARLEKNISSSELASRLGLSKSQLSRFENGQSVPTDAMIKKIQAELGAKISYNGY